MYTFFISCLVCVGSSRASWQDRSKGRKGMSHYSLLLSNTSMFPGGATENFLVEISKHVLILPWCMRMGSMMVGLLLQAWGPIGVFWLSPLTWQWCCEWPRDQATWACPVINPTKPSAPRISLPKQPLLTCLFHPQGELGRPGRKVWSMPFCQHCIGNCARHACECVCTPWDEGTSSTLVWPPMPRWTMMARPS